jgi:hypothetical protein
MWSVNRDSRSLEVCLRRFLHQYAQGGGLSRKVGRAAILRA